MRYAERYVVVSEGFERHDIAMRWGEIMAPLLSKYGSKVYLAVLRSSISMPWIIVRSITERDKTVPRFICNSTHNLVTAIDMWDNRVRTGDSKKSRMLVAGADLTKIERIK